MAVRKRHGEADDRQARPGLIDDDRAWGPIFGVMIISGLILALLLLLNGADNVPQQLSRSAASTASPAQPAAPPTQRQ
jgi:hypothetical protein